MGTTQNEGIDRIFFLDNLRYLMVLLVVVLHAACGYSYYTTWWTVNDDNSVVFNYILKVLGKFLMPTLFFIAGYFTLPSLRPKGTWRFIKNKFKRLGLPWLIGVILLNPVHIYIREYSRGDESWNLWSAFLLKMKSAVSFKTGFIDSAYQFSHHHFWFISLLLLFFILFALLHKGKSRLFPNSFSSDISVSPSSKSILLVMFLVSVVAAILTADIHRFFFLGRLREPWLMIANLIEFQPTRVVLYILCFSLGIYAFYKKWFMNGKAPGHFILWGLLALVLYFVRDYAVFSIQQGFSVGMGLTAVFSQIFLFFSTLLTFISFGIKFWDSSSKINRLLAENSYNIYLLHMVFVVLIQLFLYYQTEISIFIKFAIVGLAAISLSYISSQFVLRKFPKLTVAGMLGVFALLLIFVK